MTVYVLCAAACLVAYLICGIPTAYVLGRVMGKVDVRTVGSGNVGSTNIARSVGAKAGVLTLLLDVLKAVLAMFIGYGLVGFVGTGQGFAEVVPGGTYDWTMALVYMFCILGHVFTPYLKFKGGKGIAVGFGGALALMPLAGVSLLIPFLLFAVTTRYVSLGSIAAAVSLPFLAAWIYHPSTAFLVIVTVVALLVIWAHRSNIVKLVHGRESKFSFKKKASAAPESGMLHDDSCSSLSCGSAEGR